MEPFTVYMAYVHVLTINPEIRGLMLLSVMFLLISRLCADGHTSIVGARRANDIVIGADSRSSRRDGVALQRCKIVQVHDIFFTFAGPSIIPEFSFNALDIATNSCDVSGTVADKVVAFERAIEPALKLTVERVRQLDKAAFDDLYGRGDRLALQVLIAGLQNDIPVLYSREYQVTTSSDVPSEIKPTPPRNFTKNLAPKEVELVFHGECQAILDLISQQHDIFDDFDPVASIRDWITLESTVRPDVVGLPIDILRINKDGASWIQKKGQCPDIKPYSPSARRKAKSVKRRKSWRRH